MGGLRLTLSPGRCAPHPPLHAHTQSIFSNWGACVQIYAPGSGIRSADNEIRNRYVYMWGSSQAAPFVSGALALFLQVRPAAHARYITGIATLASLAPRRQGLRH